ncbi:pyridoxal phosphate-dependent decarboxylase family protein [Pseudoalteromonas sp. S16_S37]|uniref:pyridoxal phosphate-dependent decarboxylase family protein n=1 Tax=Pseudoalteromonas sp. S16_S37 TaxID=2720228 RepID=UPI001680E8E5|nr:aminotransferase class I/II-fold pyridoxal phosphate-dependent enzyme [Pseudoalteromonas sp. S16_S37]MBD1583749.1 aspartate aminotransferase family protein [Pseudoalteromonas sp. S16_S37]
MQFNLENNQQLLKSLGYFFEKFHQQLDTLPVASKQIHLPDIALSEHPRCLDELNQVIEAQLSEHVSGSNGPRYWGFVTGGANPVATYADWLVTTYNQNVSKGGDSIASSFERQAINWLLELFSLPKQFSGLFTTGATSANLLGALVARQFAGAQQGIDIAKQGMFALDVQVFSACPHASMIKSLGLAGFGQHTWQSIACLANSEAMDVDALSEALKNSRAKSKIVLASAATVTGTDYDDLMRISALCKAHNAWLHVDAAFGMFERLVSGPTGKTRGLELADSITLDCHKWLNVPYDCGVFLTRHHDVLKQTCHVGASYLVQSDEFDDYLSLGIENSRRFRAFPVWCTLFAYGQSGIREAVERNISQAKALAQWLDSSPYYDLLKPCELNVVVFAPSAKHPLSSSAECQKMINSSGEIFVTPGQWQGKATMRAAFSNWSTQMSDVERGVAVLERISQA